MNKIHPIVLILLIVLIPVVGYGIMHLLAYALPVSDSQSTRLLYTVLIIAFGLTIPYWILKLTMHTAHVENQNEPELNLRDLPKDQSAVRK